MQPNSAHAHCVENITYGRITVSEKGKSVTFVNKGNAAYRRVRVDDCVITNGPRADWIVHKAPTQTAIIELKGRDVGHAVDQLFATLAHASCQAWCQHKTKLLVVCAKFPSFDTKIAKAQLRAKKAGVTLKIVCKSFECEIEHL